MDRYPVPAKIRLWYEAAIRVIDMITYLAVVGGGVYALIGTPNTVVDELVGWDWVIILWAALLLVGGSAGFIGRLTRFWFAEVPATVLAFTGAGIYFLILGRFAFASITSGVAVVMVFVAMLVMLRRYAELQIFASDPHSDFRTRLADALRRRTANFVARDR